MKKTIKKLAKYVKKNLSKKRALHCLGVAKTAYQLADFFQLDRNKAVVAALGHDLAREKKKGQIRKILGKKYNPDLPEALQHGAAAAVMLERKFYIQDEEILEAVRSHTLGNHNPSPYDALIYIADFLEPGRKLPEKMVKQIMEKNLFYLLYQINRESIEYQRSKDKELFPQTELMQQRLEQIIRDDLVR